MADCPCNLAVRPGLAVGDSAAGLPHGELEQCCGGKTEGDATEVPRGSIDVRPQLVDEGMQKGRICPLITHLFLPLRFTAKADMHNTAIFSENVQRADG